MKSDPPRVSVGQALAIGFLLVVGFFLQQNGQALLFLVILLGAVAFLLNRLFAWILAWVDKANRKDKS